MQQTVHDIERHFGINSQILLTKESEKLLARDGEEHALVWSEFLYILGFQVLVTLLSTLHAHLSYISSKVNVSTLVLIQISL